MVNQVADRSRAVQEKAGPVNVADDALETMPSVGLYFLKQKADALAGIRSRLSSQPKQAQQQQEIKEISGDTGLAGAAIALIDRSSPAEAFFFAVAQRQALGAMRALRERNTGDAQQQGIHPHP